jgi:peptidoglycan-associated lipoprotein
MMKNWRLAAIGFVFALAALVSGCIEYPNCENDDHCQEKGEYCLNGKCAQCRTDPHCSEGQRCLAGACERVPGWCKSNDMCTGRQKCRDSLCGPECLDNAECGSNEECKAGQCQVKHSCVVDADCPAGQACQAGACVGTVAAAACENMVPVYFDFDESSLRADARETLRNHAECVKNRTTPLQVEGHCDSRGTEAFNLGLGERRARSTKGYMVQLGDSRSQLSIISYGESRPAKYGQSEAVFQLNRRCEFVWK